MRHGMSIVLVLVVAACGGSSNPGPERFHANLNVAEERPTPNVGTATPSGTATFSFDGTTVTYSLSATGMTTNIAASHIHLGAPAVPGGVIRTLALPTGATSGQVTAATFTAPDATAKNADGSTMTFAQLIAAIRTGQTYVNVHTSQNPAGEIRGQVLTGP